MTFSGRSAAEGPGREAAKNISHDLPLTVNDQVAFVSQFLSNAARPRHRGNADCGAPGVIAR